MSIAVKRMSDGEDWDPIRLKREKRRLVQRKADRKRRRRRENPIIRERVSQAERLRRQNPIVRESHNRSANLSRDRYRANSRRLAPTQQEGFKNLISPWE